MVIVNTLATFPEAPPFLAAGAAAAFLPAFFDIAYDCSEYTNKL